MSGFKSAVNKAVGAAIKQGGKNIKQSIRLLRQCIKKKDKCDLEVNLLIVGTDNYEMKKHIQRAQISQMYRTVVLTYTKRPNSRKGWYRNKRECKEKPLGTDCDEYPMRTTEEGGNILYQSNMVSLKGVDPRQNRSVGGHYGFLARKMKHQDELVVITSNTLPTIALPIK